MADVAVIRPLLLGFATLVASCAMTAAIAQLTMPVDDPPPDIGDPPPRAWVQRATVRIDAIGCGWRSTGSGVLIGHRLIASNRHVVAGASVVDVAGLSPSGPPWYSEATVIGVAADQDLVLLRLRTPTRSSPVALAPAGFRIKEAVGFGGFPGGRWLRVRSAHASSRWSRPAPSSAGPVWVLSEPGAPGMSGGPVLNGDGQLAGIVFASEESSQTTLALGSDQIAELVAETGTATDPITVGC